MANQYDPIAIKSGILTILGTDTLRADRLAAAGLTITGPVSGDACQVSGALTLGKAVNTSTSPIVGVYDGETNSVVRKGVVVATMKAGVTLANGDTVWLSSTAGALTNVKPTKDMLHEVGVVVHAASSKVLLQQKPVIALPPSPPLSNFISADDGPARTILHQMASPSGADLGTVTSANFYAGVWDGNLLWWGGGANPTTVRAVDPTTRTVVKGPFTIAAYDFNTCSPNPRSLAFDGHDYWITGDAGKSVYKFKSDGTVLGQVTGLGATYDGASLGFCYDGQGYIWCDRCGDGWNRVHKIAVGASGGAPGAVINITSPHLIPPYNYSGAVIGGYYYWIGGDKAYPYYQPYDMYLCRVNIAGAPVVTSSNWLFYGYTYSGLVSDGTYLYNLDNGAGVRKYDVSAWPTVTIPWYVGGGGPGYHMDYDGLYLWSTNSGGSSQYWRISTVDGSRSNFANKYYNFGLVTIGRVLP
jgi:hypothetical protein